MRRLIVCTAGTRPEAIKMAPLVAALRREPWADCHLVATGQHRELLADTLAFFGLRPDVHLDAMLPGQSLGELHQRLMAGVGGVLDHERPALVLAAGDTSSVLASALASFERGIPFAHVEAGLRTHDLAAPYPEEANRVLTARLASLNFAPTVAARANLLAEGIPADRIYETGNPVIDALHMAVQRLPRLPKRPAPFRTILVTAHRRESLGEPLERICRAVEQLVRRHPEVEILWPVHPNPAVRGQVERRLGGLSRVRLCPPLGYGPFVAALADCHLVLTDSGGVQEEAPALGKPVLVLRETSERPEAIAAGAAQLVGTDVARIAAAVERLLTDPFAYRQASRATSPYGDGHASERIVAACRAWVAGDLSESVRSLAASPICGASGDS